MRISQQLEQQCQKFATSLLDHVRSSYELEVLLNYSNDTEDVWEPGERHSLDRLELGIKYIQKEVDGCAYITEKKNEKNKQIGLLLLYSS